jgi:acyl dehydratase
MLSHAMKIVRGRAEAQALVGLEFLTPWQTISQARIDQFAAASGDHQWIHVDPARARVESPFESTIAHGFLTLSLLSSLLESVVLFEGFAMGINYGLNKLRFTLPVKAGEQVRGRFKLASLGMIAPKDDRGEGLHMEWHATVEGEGAPKPALYAEWLTRRYLDRTTSVAAPSVATP